jgi:hypothetical protein
MRIVWLLMSVFIIQSSLVIAQEVEDIPQEQQDVTGVRSDELQGAIVQSEAEQALPDQASQEATVVQSETAAVESEPENVSAEPVTQAAPDNEQVSSEEKPQESPAAPADEQTVSAAQEGGSEALQPSQEEKAPEAVSADTLASDEPLQEQEEVAIDTVDLNEPRGNWLVKRWWWEQAEIAYEKVKQKENVIFEQRMQFLKRRIDLDKDALMPFYKVIGFDQGELVEIVSVLIDRLNEHREQKGVLNEKEREFLELLQNKQKVLEQLAIDVEAIAEVDSAIDDALLKLMEQVNLARSYERQAWTYFKAIARELNDQRAHKFYEEIKALSHNIGDILKYVEQPYAQYFLGLEKKAVENIEKIKATIQSLKEAGIDLKKEAQQLERESEQSENERRAAASERDTKKASAEKESSKKQTGGMFSAIGSFFVMILNALIAPFVFIGKWIYSWFA